MNYYDIFDTSMGWVGAVTSDAGLKRTTLPRVTPDECAYELGQDLEGATHEPDRFTILKGRLEALFDGQPEAFEDIPLDYSDAPPFLQAAWDACRSIPRGETRTYKWLAGEAGRPQAPRAAGQSMARNRLPLVIPCHRVIGSDGTLRGFGRGAGQLDLKRHLLELEGTRVAA